jgi:ribosome-binding protein aMBF1 (putative translation factor)
MTPDTLGAALATIRWSTTDLAHALGADERRVRRWKAGRYPVPPKVAKWLMDLAAAHLCHPAPGDWRDG